LLLRDKKVVGVFVRFFVRPSPEVVNAAYQLLNSGTSTLTR
jgi:hypothetical protein